MTVAGISGVNRARISHCEGGSGMMVVDVGGGGKYSDLCKAFVMRENERKAHN